MSPTEHMLRALKWLRNRNGDGGFNKHKVLLAGGELAPVRRATWNKLASADLVEFYQDRRRLRVTDSGNLVDVSQVEEST